MGLTMDDIELQQILETNQNSLRYHAQLFIDKIVSNDTIKLLPRELR